MEFDIALRAFVALIAGGIIGLERTYHGRAAGARTYALVCFGSALLVAAVALPQLAAHADVTQISAEVSRVVQGIMTGVGFLGAGVIVKEGFSVRGLTTAAAVWVTAAVGVLIGLAYYGSAAAGTLLTFATLSVVRTIEARMPALSFVHCHISFVHGEAMDEDSVRSLVEKAGFQIAEISYRFYADKKVYEYRMILWTKRLQACGELATRLSALPALVEFKLSPSRD